MATSRHCRASSSISCSIIARPRPRPRQSRATTIMLRVPAGPNGVAMAVPTNRSPSKAAIPRLRPRISAQSSSRCGQPSARESATAPSRWAGISGSRVAVLVSVIGHLLTRAILAEARRADAAPRGPRRIMLRCSGRRLAAGNAAVPGAAAKAGRAKDGTARNKLPQGTGRYGVFCFAAPHLRRSRPAATP